MISRIDLDRLKESPEDYDLYQIACRASGHKTGTHEIDISDLRIAPTTRFRLAQWGLLSNQPNPEPVVQTPVEPVAVTAPPVQPEEQINLAEYEREQLQRATDEARGLARIEQHAAEQGLERSPENAAAIKDWLEKNAKGYISAAGVDAAIQNLGPKGSNVLTWIPKTVEPSPQPEPATETEVLGTLKDGSRQLPLDATPSKHHTTAQLKDWLARVNANRIIRPSGSFISSF